MKAPIVYWYGAPPTPRERAALARAAAAGKLPRVSNARRARVRSSTPAVAAFTGFHWGERPEKITRTRLPSYSKGLLKLGDLRAVEYEASKGGQRAIWVHKFTRPYPTLTATPSGRLGPIVGGAAHVTSRGIEK